MTELKYEDVKAWLGGDGNLSIEEMIEIILDVANGDYNPEILNQNISEYREV